MSVLLKRPIFGDVSQKELAQQLEGKKKSRKKLPSYFEAPGIYYPKKIHLEQSSSEATAAYKARLVSGKSLVDINGGLGVDTLYFGRKMETVLHCEINPVLQQIAAHNLKVLEASNCISMHVDGLTYLKDEAQTYDWIYADPARRDEHQNKIYRLQDCYPNIVPHLSLLYSKADNILLKTSPLLDLAEGTKVLDGIRQIHIIAVENEVKELLWVLKKEFHGPISCKTVNLREANEQEFSFEPEQERKAVSRYSEPLAYLYEPNAAIMKSGAFKLIGAQFRLFKLHRHTHLYTSKELIDFPGRRFKVLQTAPFSKALFKKLGIRKANLAARNFPMTVATIRNKFKIADGGKDYLFFCKNEQTKPIVIRAEKV